MDHVALVVEKAADKIGKVAGAVGSAAAMATPFTAEIPVVGEVVAGVAAGAKAVDLYCAWRFAWRANALSVTIRSDSATSFTSLAAGASDGVV